MCGHPKCRATCRTASNGIDVYGSFWCTEHWGYHLVESEKWKQEHLITRVAEGVLLASLLLAWEIASS